MRFVLGNRLLTNVGGTEVHLAILGSELERLGHEAVLYAPELGPYAEHLCGRGLAVAGDLRELPEDCDVVLSQDTLVAYDLGARYPGALHAFRLTGESFDFQLPPQVAQAIDVVVVLSERHARIANASGVTAPVLRLRIPVEADPLAPVSGIRERPRKAVMLGNYGGRFELVRSAWAECGVEVERVGQANGSQPSFDLGAALAGADIVVGKNRAALDGMASGRAVYVYDVFGGDGWVTAELYPELEADHFAGLATGRAIGREELQRDLRAYDADMGTVNRDLVLQHHLPRTHTVELIEALKALAPAPDRPVSAERELARLTSLQWSWEVRARELLSSETALGERLAEEQDARALTEYHRAVAEQRSAELERELAGSQTLVEEMRATRAWRLAGRYWSLKDRLLRKGRDAPPERSSIDTT